MGFFIKNQILCKKKSGRKRKEGKEKEKKLVAARIELGTLNRCTKQRRGEGTVSCIWKLGTSIENRGSMALQV